MAEWIPYTVGLSQATWHRYRERLEDIVVRHPSLFKGYRRGSHDFDDFGLRRGRTYADEWGCIWHFPLDGMQGQVIGHPLEEWRGLDSYEPPDPVAAGLPQEGAPLIDWDLVLRSMDEAKERGDVIVGHCPHGFMFQRLCYLRGFVNLMRDIVTQPTELEVLIDMVLVYNMRLIDRWLKMGVDVVAFGDDLGAQTGLTVNPRIFRRLLLPGTRLRDDFLL